MVYSDFAVNLQCLGKLYSGTIYSGKKEISMNIFTGIYSPNLLHNPPV